MRLKTKQFIIKKEALLFMLTLSVLISVVLSSCSSSGEGQIDSESEISFSSLEVIPPADSAPQLGDISELPSEFKILRESKVSDIFFSNADAPDIMSKTVYERNSLLLRQYGITLSEEPVSDIVTRVTNDMLSEESDYDMLVLGVPSSASLITSGALCDLESLAGFDSSAKGYYTEVISDLSLGGRSFLAAGDATPSLLRSTSAVMVNRDLLSKVTGSDSDLFEIAKNGKFTYDLMLKYAAGLASLNASEVALPQTSFIRADAEDALALFFGGDGHFFDRDEVTDEPFAADFGGANSDIFASVMSLYGISVNGEDEGDEEISSASASPIFTVVSIAELEALADATSPYAALPMPKMQETQVSYISNVDMTKAAFTALPSNGDSEVSVRVMNLIYSLSEGIPKLIKDKCEPEGSDYGTFELIEESISCDLLTFFGFGDLPSMMTSFVNEQSSLKVFELRAAERSTAAVTALSIVISKLNQ